MATVYDVLDTRDKQELAEKIDADKNELSKTIQNTKIELQSNIDALESQHDEDKTNLQTQIDSLESTKADKTEITAHNTSNTAHNDIRLLIQNLTTKLNTIADSDDSTLDQMSEIVEYIKNNKELIDSITTTKVSVSDIINNLVTNVANKPLSAAMGVELKALIDAIPDTTLATVNEKILEHNVSADAHEDMRNDIVSVQSDATAAQTTADAAQALANNAQDDADEALQRLNSLEVGSGKIDRIVDGGGILTCEDPLIGAPLIKTGVRGRTVKNLWPVLSGTNNGITVSTDETGLITVTGTATGDSHVYAITNGIRAGASITCKLSISAPTNNTWTPYIEIVDSEGAYITSGKLNGSTAIPSNAADIRCGIHVYVGQTVNASFRVMLVDGTEAPDCFTPCASITSAQPENLVTSGKNLFPTGDDEGWYKGGYSISRAFINRDVLLTLPFTSVTESNGVGNAFRVVAGQTYTLTVTGYPSDFSTGICWALYEALEDTNDPTKAVSHNYGGNSAKSVTTGALPISGYLVVCVAGLWTDGKVNSGTYPAGMRIQCELGSTATAYEPPRIIEVALPETDPLMYIYDRGDELVIAQDGAVTVERNTYHQLFDGADSNVYVPVEADGYQYVALNSTKDKPTGVNISMNAVISDRFATGKKAPGNVVVTTGSVSGDGRNYIAFLFCFESGTFADSDEARQWFADNPTNVWFAGMPEIEYLGTIEPPTLPAQTSHVWFSSNIPVNDFSVRYWLPNGELVEELYRTGATEEISDNEIISIWNGVTGDIIEATNADIEAIFE